MLLASSISKTLAILLTPQYPCYKEAKGPLSRDLHYFSYIFTHGGNHIPELLHTEPSQLAVPDPICWRIPRFPPGKTQQVQPEKQMLWPAMGGVDFLHQWPHLQRPPCDLS